MTRIILVLMVVFFSGCASQPFNTKSDTGLGDDPFSNGGSFTAANANAINNAVNDNDTRLDLSESQIGPVFSDGDGTYSDASAISLTELLYLNGLTGSILSAPDFTQDGGILVGTGSGAYQEETGLTFRMSIGLGTGDSPLFTGIELGDVSDTTISRVGAGQIAVEGDNLIRASDVDDTPVNGETAVPPSSNWAYDHEQIAVTEDNANSYPWAPFPVTTDRVLGIDDPSGTGDLVLFTLQSIIDLGQETYVELGYFTQDGGVLVGTGAGTYQEETGLTFRTSVGLGPGDTPLFTGIDIGDVSDTTLTRAAAGQLAVEGDNLIRASDIDYSLFGEDCFTIPNIYAQPDQLQAETDAWPVMHFPAERFSGGFTVTSIQIATSATCTDTLNFEEWSNNGTSWTTVSTVENITLSGTFTEDDGTFSDASIAADSWLFVDLDASTDDISFMTITVCGY